MYTLCARVATKNYCLNRALAVMDYLLLLLFCKCSQIVTFIYFTLLYNIKRVHKSPQLVIIILFYITSVNRRFCEFYIYFTVNFNYYFVYTCVLNYSIL